MTDKFVGASKQIGQVYFESRGCSIGGGFERGGDFVGMAKLDERSRISVIGCSLRAGGGAGAGWAAVRAESMEKLESASDCEIDRSDRTIGMGRVRKSPVLGSTLRPTFRPDRTWLKRKGSAGGPFIAGGENRLLRSVGGAAGHV